MIEIALLLLGIGTTEFTVAVRDAATGKPLDGAFVVAREFTTVGQFHGSKTYCIRGDVAQVEGPRVSMWLPSAGTDSLHGARAIEAFAYRPGYCLARTADGRAASYALHGPTFGAERPKPLDPAVETRLEMRRSTQGPEDRLLYLGEMVQGLVCDEPRWSDRGREGLEQVSKAMVAEAEGLARNRYEKSLVEKMKGWLVIAREMKPDQTGMVTAMGIQSFQPLTLAAGFPRDFIVAHPDARVSWDASRNMAIVATRGSLQSAQPMPPGGSQPGYGAVATPGGAIAQGVVVQPGVTITAPRLQPVIHCRHGAPSACDLNERDARGSTAIGSYVAALKPAEVKVLLDAGADPSIASKPSGVAPIETLVERLARTQPDSADAQNAAEILELLVAHPKVTLRQKLKDDFAADPATWTSVQHSAGRQLLVDARPRLLALPALGDEPPACAPLGYTRDYSHTPIRLRYP